MYRAKAYNDAIVLYLFVVILAVSLLGTLYVLYLYSLACGFSSKKTSDDSNYKVKAVGVSEHEGKDATDTDREAET